MFDIFAPAFKEKHVPWKRGLTEWTHGKCPEKGRKKVEKTFVKSLVEKNEFSIFVVPCLKKRGGKKFFELMMK